MPMPTPTLVRILFCGGTIDKVYFDAKSDYQVGSPQAVNVLNEANVTLNYTQQSLFQKDSLEINEGDRELIRTAVRSAEEPRVMITHGTDTMIETAKGLQCITNKTVVLTGSITPARFRSTDALFNIGFALGVVQTLPAGIYIAMHGCVLDPLAIRKNREESRFEMIGSPVRNPTKL